MKLQLFGQHAQALQLRELRHQVLSSNIANADTPHYKARDIDFGAALEAAQATNGGGTLGLKRTSELHSSGGDAARFGAELRYRVPTQPSLDGNTVETDVEQAQFAENALRYRATLGFVDGAIKTLRYAIRGSD